LLEILDPADVAAQRPSITAEKELCSPSQEQGFDFRWLLAGCHWETASKMSLAVSEAI
jgi:hypothetical protein